MAQFPHNALLTRFARERSMGLGPVGARLAPQLLSDTGAVGEYAVFKRKRGTNEVDPKRAPGDKVKRVTIEQYTMEQYKLTDHTIDVVVPFEFERAVSDPRVLGLLQDGVAKAQRIIQERHERTVADLFWSSTKAGFVTKYGANQVTDPTAKWDTTSAQIKVDILNAKESMYDKTGFYPNRMFIPTAVYNKLVGQDNEIRDALKFTAFGAQTMETLARYFEVEEIIVPRYLIDQANSGQAENFTKLWTGESIGLFYVNDNPTVRTDSLAYTIYIDEPEAPFFGSEVVYDRDIKSYVPRCTAFYDVKTVDLLCGHIIADVLTT
jgi:hypothetical protein